MSKTSPFDAVARLPSPRDNVAIASQTLPAGTHIAWHGSHLEIDYTVLEGHRFAVTAVGQGEPLLSWGLPFGFATRDIEPGNYICNERVLWALRSRNVDFQRPSEANFEDKIQTYALDEERCHPSEQVPLKTEPRNFRGYSRTGNRGVGTRNYIVVLGTSSRAASYARVLADRFSGAASGQDHFDGVVAVSHTEGGGSKAPNNQELLLRTLAGFVVHPNVGAVLAVDWGSEAITNLLLNQYMEAHGYALPDVLHEFLTLGSDFQTDLQRGGRIVQNWLDPVSRFERREHSLAHLKLALQCGGSDAFSGISGNPLAGWVAKELIQFGGSANLAETDELVGAEDYVLQKVRSVEIAHQFLARVERFKERAAWHGETAEGNPSGGNIYRGLYNIVLKSIGAAAKRHPEVRLDYVIDYGEPMRRPGFYFMDSPGNDLESIAGQVASGANMIFFTTGNGSITNFPFVPTIKIVTTSGRFDLLSDDMDVNAGRYLDGSPLPEVGQDLLDLATSVASGARSVGEKAGHSQVSIWRNWPQSDASALADLSSAAEPEGTPLLVKSGDSTQKHGFDGIPVDGSHTTDQIALILPTSLCSSQIARLITQEMNARRDPSRPSISRFESLPHTEGCGVSGGRTRKLYLRTMLGHLAHPIVRFGLLLEHGCEITHNDYMSHELERMGLDPTRFGWASVQMDGGIEKVKKKVQSWFDAAEAANPTPARERANLEALRIGLLSSGPLSQTAADSLIWLTQSLVDAGATVVMPQSSTLLSSSAYLTQFPGPDRVQASIAYGQIPQIPGMHIMECPTEHWVETLTGLGATGIEVTLAHIADHPQQTHPMVPLLQVAENDGVGERFRPDLDLVLEGDSEHWMDQQLQLILRVASGRYAPVLHTQGNADFQITRGLLGVSM